MKLDKKIFFVVALILALSFSLDLSAQADRLKRLAEDAKRVVKAESGGEIEPVIGRSPETTEPTGTVIKSDLEGPLAEEELVYLNVQDADIKDVIKQISKATGKNFIIDDKIRGKVTIISERPMTREEAYQTFLSALEVAGYTTVKGPANVIKVVSLKDAAKSPIPTHVDSTPYTDSFVTRLIPLENISALDMSNAIKDLVSRDGNLFAYPATNTLIITDSGSNIGRIMKIVKELDQEGPQRVLEIIPIRNARAGEVAKMVQDLFQEEKKKTSRTTRSRSKSSQLEEMAEVSKIIADERTNSIIVLASKRAIENVRSIIKRLDMGLRPDEEGRIHVYYLKHAKAKDLAETLSALTQSAGAKTKKGGTDIAIAQFEGGLKITADESTNSLIVTALPKDFQTLIDRVISKLDIPRLQVYFEAVIMEMAIAKGSTYGVRSFGGFSAGGQTIGIGQSLGGPSYLGGLMSSGAWPAFLGGVMSSRTTDITVLGANGTSSTVSVPAFSAFLSAMSNRGETNVVSTPNLLTLDNEEAKMHILSKEPMPGSTTFGASGVTTATSVDYKEAGLEMTIKPQISEHDMIVLEIKQKLSNFVTPSYSTNLQAPALKERSVETTVVTESGETVVMAGLMEDISRRTKTKIPLLGDIPILGFLFSVTENQMAKSNLLIFITPHIIRDKTDFMKITKRKIEQRNNFLESNYSKSKQKKIRSMIRSHREDLLEFSEPMPVSVQAQELIGPTSIPSSAEKLPSFKAPQMRPAAEPVQPRATTGRQPVITVPQSSSRGVAYPPRPVIQPIVPQYQPPPQSYAPPVQPDTRIFEKPVVPTYRPPATASKKLQPIVEKPVTRTPKKAKSRAPEFTEQKTKTSMKKVVPWIAPGGPREFKKPSLPTSAFDSSDRVKGKASQEKIIEREVVRKEKISKGKIIEEETIKEVIEKPVRQKNTKTRHGGAEIITIPDEPQKPRYNKPSPGSRNNGDVDLAY